MASEKYHYSEINHWACFNCRKSFKRCQRLYHPIGSGSSDITLTDPMTCPQCGGPQYRMGRQFKAPKQSDKEQWAKVEALISLGMKFESGYSGLPERLNEVTPFLEDLRKLIANKNRNPKKEIRLQLRVERRERRRKQLKKKKQLLEEKRIWEYQNSL